PGARLHCGCVSRVRGAGISLGMAAQPSGDSVDSNLGGGNHRLGAHHCDPRTCPAHRRLAGSSPGHRSRRLSGTPAQHASRARNCCRFRGVADRGRHDLFPGSAGGLSSHRTLHDHPAVSDSVCHLRRQHCDSHLRPAPPDHHLRNRPRRAGLPGSGLWRYARNSRRSRSCTRRVCATYAGALLLAGSFLLFSATLRVPFLCAAAVAAVFLYAGAGKLSLGIHSSFYLAAAAAVSSLPQWAASALAGTVPPAPDWSIWIVTVSAALCYLVGSRPASATHAAQDQEKDQKKRRLLWVLPAVLVGFAGAALAVVAIVWLAAGR